MQVPVRALLVALLAQAVPLAAQGDGQLDGVVRDAAGAPLAGAIVRVSGPAARSERTGVAGRYRVSGLPPGTYTISASHPGMVAVEQSLELQAGTPATLDLTLTPSARETIVVTAARIEESLIDAPSTMSVVSADTIAASPGQNYGDLLRSVPGLNVIQSSARDVNLASRRASPFLANSQLALVDGRTLYFDFFNVVFWDLVPVTTADIKQIEVVRGPASAVWGANAASGVVNIITKTPREAQGVMLSLVGGGFSRDAGDAAGEGAGGQFGASLSIAKAAGPRFAYRASVSYFDSDALPRPAGTIPLSRSPVDPTVVVGGGSYGDASFANRGTRQPKLDLRVDQELAGGGTLRYSAGVAGTEGIIHTPIGPFDIERDSRLGYARVAFARGSLHLSAFANLLNGDAPNLLTRDALGNVLRIDFNTRTYDLEGGHSQLVGDRHLLSYGANLRHNTFDISITPAAEDRTEVGAYVQDEIFAGRRLRVSLSARVDKFANISGAFVSPRAAVIFKPTPAHALRASFNRAFRSPSAVDNYLDIAVIGGSLPLGAIDPVFGAAQFPFPTRTIGNPDLKAESLNAYELNYTGTFGERTTASVSLYLDDSHDVISNAANPGALLAQGIDPFYSSLNPPPGWPLPPQVLDLLALQGIRLPALIMTLNQGDLRHKGIELSLDHSFNGWLSANANYSRQAVPRILTPASDPTRFPASSVAVPPRNRFNAGVKVGHERYLGSLSVNHAGEAFWADVLTPAFYGFSEGYTLVNASFGVRWRKGRVTTTLKASNLLNEDVQQHIFGDILKRSVVGELRLTF
jgi:iron complex outermembrane receptor protein